MQVVAEMHINIMQVLENHGLNDGGKAQQYVDKECIERMKEYTPMDSGALMNSVERNSVIGSGELHQVTPYARYQYYGQLYVDPLYQVGGFYDPVHDRWWSRPKIKKVPSQRMLNYNQIHNPKAGSHWFERMAADNKDDIGRHVAEMTGGIYTG